MAILERLKQFAESGEASQAFDKQAKKNPKWAVETALDRTYGRAAQRIESTHSEHVEVTADIRVAILQALGLPAPTTGSVLVPIEQKPELSTVSTSGEGQ